MHSGEAKIVYLVEEHLQTEEKIRMGGRVDKPKLPICFLLLSDLFYDG
jgi:hypothetical protein